MSDKPFGVELPENFDTPPAEGGASSSAAPEGASNAAEARESAPAAAPERGTSTTRESKEPQVQDLDSLERFRFRGKDLTRDELAALVEGKENPQPTASRFDLNFRADLEVVLSDPKRLTDLKAVYPPEYVRIAERILAQQPGSTSQPGSAQVSESDKMIQALKSHPEFKDLFGLRDQLVAKERESNIQFHEQQLERAFDKLSKKYPEAEPEVVNARALALSQMGHKLCDDKGKLNEAVIEKLFKEDHDRREAHYQQKYRSKVDAQKQVNSRARDAGAGGAAPSPAGKTARNIKEATAALLADLEATGSTR